MKDLIKLFTGVFITANLMVALCMFLAICNTVADHDKGKANEPVTDSNEVGAYPASGYSKIDTAADKKLRDLYLFELKKKVSQ